MPRRAAQKCQRRTTADGLHRLARRVLETGNPLCRDIDGAILKKPAEFRALWNLHRDEITAAWIARHPGSRPMAAYIVGEISPPPWQRVNHHFREPITYGDAVVIPDRSWHVSGLEVQHLVTLGIVKGIEERRALAAHSGALIEDTDANAFGHPDNWLEVYDTIDNTTPEFT